MKITDLEANLLMQELDEARAAMRQLRAYISLASWLHPSLQERIFEEIERLCPWLTNEDERGS